MHTVDMKVKVQQQNIYMCICASTSDLSLADWLSPSLNQSTRSLCCLKGKPLRQELCSSVATAAHSASLSIGRRLSTTTTQASMPRSLLWTLRRPPVLRVTLRWAPSPAASRRTDAAPC